MTTQTDVLAVLDPRAALTVKPSAKNPNAGFVDMRDWFAYLAQADAARAAVAALIEADREVDRIEAKIRTRAMAGRRHGAYGTGWEERDAASLRALEAAHEAAHERRAAALANMGGQS